MVEEIKMSEYRDVEPLRKQTAEFKTALKQFAKSSSFLMAYISGIDAVMEIIDESPITDVQEVRHGYWIEDIEAEKGCFCSVCGNGWLITLESDYYKSDFCPNCGARMDGEEE